MKVRAYVGIGRYRRYIYIYIYIYIYVTNHDAIQTSAVQPREIVAETQRHTSSLKSFFVRRTIARGRAILRHAPNNTDGRYLPDTNIKQRRETVMTGEGRRKYRIANTLTQLFSR